MAVKFFVKTKFPTGTVTRGMALPKTSTACRSMSKRRAHSVRSRSAGNAACGRCDAAESARPHAPRPAWLFDWISNPRRSVRDDGHLRRTRQDVTPIFILSNNHVLADENRLPLGSPIYQPALMDGGKLAQDQIAELARFIKLKVNRYNKIDAAIAEPLTRNLLDGDVLHIGAPGGTATAEIDIMVYKFGRTTSYTAGRITSVDTDVIVEYETADFPREPDHHPRYEQHHVQRQRRFGFDYPAARHERGRRTVVWRVTESRSPTTSPTSCAASRSNGLRCMCPTRQM